MYIRSLASLDVQPLPGSEGIVEISPPPFWSEDSKVVVYAAKGKIKTSEVTGTPAQSIADTSSRFLQGATSNRDGVLLYAKDSPLLVPACVRLG